MNIGKPIEIVQVEPLSAPVPIFRSEKEPEPCPKPFATSVALPVGVDAEEETFEEMFAEERSE